MQGVNLRSIFKRAAKPARRPRGKQRTVVKRLPVKIRNLGVDRNLIVELDLTKATVSVRLAGCRSRKTYQAEDLYVWGAQKSLL